MQIKKNETFYAPFEENRLAFNVDPLKPSNHIKYSELSKFDIEESSSAKEGKAVRLGRQNIYFINTINLYTGQKKLSYDKLFTAMREFHSQSLKEKKTNVTVSGVTKNPSPMMLLKKAIFKSNRFYLDKKEIRLFNLIDFSYSNSDIISKIQWFLLNGPSTISGSTDPKELDNYLIPASIIFCPKIYAFEEKAENTIHKIMKEGKGVGSTGLDVLYSLSYENEIQYEISEIKKILNDLDLSFCGFQFNDYQTRILRKEKITDISLEQLSLIEKKHPHFFGGMYHFWCQKIS